MNKSTQVKESRYAEKITVGEKIAYGGGDLASNLILVLTSTFVTFFYTDALGLNAGIIGTIMLFSRVFDGVSDMLMGFVMDQVKSKRGKARCWLYWLAIPIALATVLVFLVPNIGDTGKYIFVIITYNLVTTFLYTMINIPYGALTSLMTRDQNQRTVINIFRMFVAQVGSLIINAFTLPLINAVGGSTEQKSWIIVSVMYGILAAVLFFICYAKTEERVTISSEQEEKISFGESFKLIMKNNYWLLIVGVWVFTALSMGIGMSVGTYYAKYVLGNENLAGFLTSIALIPTLVCMPFVAPLSQKYGKRNVVKGSKRCWFCSSYRNFICHGCRYYRIWSVENRKESGRYAVFQHNLWCQNRRRCRYGSIYGNPGSSRYVGTAAVQTESAMSAITGLYLYAPLPFMIAIPILYCFYKLDKIYPQVMEDLEKREKAGKQ